MSDSKNEETTWRYDSGLATWKYRPMLLSGEGARPIANQSECTSWLRSMLVRLEILLDGFATPAEFEISTESSGEDSLVGDLRNADDLVALERFVEERSDIHDVRIDLTLHCIDSSLNSFGIENGAELSICFDRNIDGSLRTSAGGPLRVQLSLNVDIYAPLSWGLERDNRILAKLNAPMLGGALRRLERELHGGPIDLDAPDYKGQVGPYGFLLAES